ncbi:MAG: GLPGLI family protein [Bacteroidia bacterium]|nr:GLPGLI family protein [Bacteroidia bacterium]
MMITDMVCKKITVLAFLVVITSYIAQAQVTAGKITYERKTNLTKKFKDSEWARDYIKEKNKIDEFELYFNDTASVFKEKETDVENRNDWYTSKNEVYQNYTQNQKLTIKSIWGEKFAITDTLSKRVWKMTDSKRNIAGFNCRKAIWQSVDSSKLKMYAWYCNEIAPSVGPESFNGLPGAILGLATEDGGIVFFATKVETSNPNINALWYKNKKKRYTSAEFTTEIIARFGKDKWFKPQMKELFGAWQ